MSRMQVGIAVCGIVIVAVAGEDHWLTQEETRIEMLRATAKFIGRHL